jgi:hypothetical protein
VWTDDLRRTLVLSSHPGTQCGLGAGSPDKEEVTGSNPVSPTVAKPFGGFMLKKLLALAAVGAIAKIVLDKLTKGKDEDLWAEATDSVDKR